MMRAISRALLVVPVPPPWGGIGKWTVLFSSWLTVRKKPGFRIVNTSPWVREATDLRIYKRILEGTAQGIVDIFKTLFLLITWRPDILHLTTSGSLAGLRDIAVLSLARLAGVSSSYHVRIGRMPEIIKLAGWEWLLTKWAARLATSIIVIDKATQSCLKHFFKEEKLFLLPNAINLDSLDVAIPPDYDPGRKMLLFVGWVLPTKGVGELIEAWVRLPKTNWELLLVGPFREDYLSELKSKAGNRDNVRFIGEVSNDRALGWIKASDILVLPTHTEGFPNVLLEAMAASKAVIATPVGAIPEILDFDTDKPCGLKVPTGDPDALARAIQSLISDLELRTELGNRARVKVESSYSTAKVFEELLSIWADCRQG
jgi:glycosyltransferase involved in cell wall biosynthesis